MESIPNGTRCSLVPSEQSLRTKQTLKEAYFLKLKMTLMINMRTGAYYCTPVQAQLMLPLLSDFDLHISLYKCVS